MPATDPLDDFDLETLTLQGVGKPVYRKGRGPGVIVIAEIPGITPEVAGFARRVVDAGYTAWMPSLFGVPGAPRSQVRMARTVLHACISREFAVLARHRSSPVVDWIRALARHAHAACGGRGVGVVGMCLTGNFALGTVVEPSVQAPVLSQPSLPFAASPWHAAAPHCSPEALQACRARHAEDGFRVLGLRFACDALSPAARFRTLERALGPAFEGITIDNRPGSGSPHPLWAHSVLTNDLIAEEGQPTQAALDAVLRLFADRLPEAPAPG
ncbi:MAG: dienelactone hydrolase family protein [Alphaproteobacteria bacterium]|nr:dienelactone hydrolase family protein [Alphaproteobacteria bacterium]